MDEDRIEDPVEAAPVDASMPESRVADAAESGRVPSGPVMGSLAALTCPRCATPHLRGAVFCPSCRSFLEAPDVGKLASPKRRLLASFLDSAFQDGGMLGSAFGPLLIGSGRAHAVVAVLATAYWGLTLYLWTKGTTPAKRALDMDVIQEDGEPAGFLRMAFRETIGKAISWAVLGLGILSVPLDRNHQGWHDKMAGTFVVHDEEG